MYNKTKEIEPVVAEKEKEEENIGNEEKTAENQTFFSHLEELRKVLIVCIASIFVGFVVTFAFFSEAILNFITAPLTEHNVAVVYIGLAEVFTTQLRVSFIGGVLLASPILFWKVWSFLKPALFPKEKRMFSSVFFVMIFLFVAGVTFAYFLVFNIVINFFLITGEGIATPMISMERFLGLLLSFVIPFGLIFQTPVVIILLHKLGIITIVGLKKIRKYVIFGIVVLSALVTPPDIISLFMMAVPGIALYEIGIIFAKLNELRKPA
ncbi:MAG: twin-arginine translocase subunit TatC [Defluviitaleaceae bacterium]|nr:twin-arginine translocase subunit TatC [Defluviitaleaceae bacterium]